MWPALWVLASWAEASPCAAQRLTRRCSCSTSMKRHSRGTWVSSARTLLAAWSGSPSLKMVVGWPHRISVCLHKCADRHRSGRFCDSLAMVRWVGYAGLPTVGTLRRYHPSGSECAYSGHCAGMSALRGLLFVGRFADEEWCHLGWCRC